MLMVPQTAMAGFFDFFSFTASPPIYGRPFAIGTAGATLQIDFQITGRRVGWNIIVTFDLEEDADRASVFKLLGNLLYADSNYKKNEPGIDTPVRLEIERFDVGEKRVEAGTEDVYEYTGRTPVDSIELPRTHTGVVYASEMHPQGVAAHGHCFFERTLGLLMSQPGKYRMTVTALKNIPEISSLKTSVSIQSYSK